MSILAGFDFVTEISNETLIKIIKSQVSIEGVLLNPPFELPLSFDLGSASLIVHDVSLDIEGDDTITLQLAFAASSVTLAAPGGIPAGPSPVRRAVAPLDGIIRINVALSLTDRPQGRRVGGDTSGAVVQLWLSPAADQVVANALAGLPFTPQQFTQAAVASLTEIIRRQPRIETPFGFPVIPTRNGSLSPSVTLTSLTMRCIGHQNRDRQALSLLGNLFVATAGNGNRSLKTQTAIRPGQDFVTSFSAQACHALLLCPSIAAAVSAQSGGAAVQPGDLPSSCGSAAAISLNGVGLTSLVDTYEEGAILLRGQVKQSGPCYSATGSFRARIVLGVGANRRSLTTVSEVEDVDVDVDVDLFCRLVMVGLGAFLENALLSGVEAIVEQFASREAVSLVRDALFSGNGVGAGGPAAGASQTLSAVSVAPEGIAMQGEIDVYVPFVSTSRMVWIEGSITASEMTAAAQGDWITRLPCEPEDKAYQVHRNPAAADLEPQPRVAARHPPTEGDLHHTRIVAGTGPSAGRLFDVDSARGEHRTLAYADCSRRGVYVSATTRDRRRHRHPGCASGLPAPRHVAPDRQCESGGGLLFRTAGGVGPGWLRRAPSR